MENSAIIVAHPDDEILWLSSHFKKATEVVACFGATPRAVSVDPDGSKRQDFFKEQPYDNYRSLEVKEAGSYGLSNWQSSELTKTGIRVQDRDVQKDYEKAYKEVVEKIMPILKGKDAVLTHNPWGEYGHPDHILVHRAVNHVAQEMNIPVYWSTYVGPCTQQLANEIMTPDKRVVIQSHSTDLDVPETLVPLFKKHDIWTWNDDYVWPQNDCVVRWAKHDEGVEIGNTAIPYQRVNVTVPSPTAG